MFHSTSRTTAAREGLFSGLKCRQKRCAPASTGTRWNVASDSAATSYSFWPLGAVTTRSYLAGVPNWSGSATKVP
jgi:hypothetical protein